MERNQRRPPDVNEALSSMLWTPYERTPSESSSDDDERLNAKLKKSKSTCDYTFPIKHNSTTNATASTQYVPSFRKIQRYDNFRFSYPYYGQMPLVQKCITELPSYESLYQNGITPELSSITGLHNGRLVHSFTDNFVNHQSRPSSAGAICDPSAAFLGITSSLSGFSNNFTDDDEVEEEDDEDDEDFDESSSNNNNGPIPPQLPSEPNEESTMSAVSRQQCSPNALSASALAEDARRWYQWRVEGMDTALRLSDNNGDLLLTKNHNISQRLHADQQQPQHHSRKYQFHNELLQERNHQEQQLQTRHQSQDQVDLKIAKQTIPSANQDRDVAVDKIQDLPGEINEPATLPVAVTIVPEILSVSEQCTSNNGEKPDTKCVRSVQTDLAFSSARLVEASVESETASSLRQFVGFNASIDTSSASRSNQINATASSGESRVLADINVYNAATNNPGNISHRHPLILDVRNSLLAMRLNIPAAQPSIVDPLKGTAIVSNNNNGNGGSAITTTSVFLPLNESLISTRIARPRSTNASVNTIVNSSSEVLTSSPGATVTSGSAIVQSKPSLTIQVNQDSDAGAIRDCIAHNSASNVEGFANQCAGISVVSCFSGSTVPNSCSVNKNVASVVTTTTSTTTATIETAGNSVNITSPNGSSASENSNSAVQSNGLQAPANQQPHHHQPSRDRDENQLNHHRPLARTFTSTECQTDDLPLVDRNEISAVIAQSQTEALINREQRRRERRERRQQGRARHPHILPPMHHQAPPPPPPPMLRPSMLPDILHSHFPPPYTALQSLANPPPPPPPSSLIAPVISTVPIATATAVNDARFTIPLPVIRRSPSERSGKGCCGQWFAGPPLRALIAVVALGGVACALGGAALGATGLAGPPTSHLTAALLMIGVGVILVTVSGAAWRMTAPGGPPCLGLGSTVDLARCGRRPCNSRGAPHGLLYPEFQHRPPPPSYQASMQEYRLRLLLLDRDRQNGVVRGGSPPPTYRSHAGSLLRAPLSTPRNAFGGPGSEYSLPPSYRSRNTNANTLTSISRQTPIEAIGGNSMESLNSNTIPGSSNNNQTSISSSNNNGNVPQSSSTSTTTILDQLQSSVSFVPHLTSSIPVNFHGSNISTIATTPITTSTSTTTTKDAVHTTIAVDAAGALQPNEQQKQHQQHFSLNQSQILNEKLNPRVTNSNNANNNINHSSSRTSNSLNNISGSSSISCTNTFGSPSRVTTSSIITTMAATGSANVTTTSPNMEQPTGTGNNRKELVTIVTISSPQEPTQAASEMEILAHL